MVRKEIAQTAGHKIVLLVRKFDRPVEMDSVTRFFYFGFFMKHLSLGLIISLAPI
jgi:hypothetical protein